MAGLFDDVLGNQESGGEKSAGLFDDVLKPKSSPITRVARDAAAIGLKSAIAVPEAAVGLADLATGGEAGKALQEVGVDFQRAQQIASEIYSPETQEAIKKVHNADGFVDTVKTAAENPSAIVSTVGESLLPMVAGGGVARGITKLAPKVAPYVAGAVGEGVVGAGSSAEQVRQQTEDGTLGADQIAPVIASGAGTALFGAVGGRVAQKLGIGDVDTMLAQGGLGMTQKGVVRRIIEGGISEGVFEELPQSVQEQVWQNAALDKPLLDGVPESAAMGLLAGGVMGGAASGLTRRGQAEQPQPAETVTEQPQPLALSNNGGTYAGETLITFPDGSAGTRRQAEEYINSLPEDERLAARARLIGYAPQESKPQGPLSRAAQKAPNTVATGDDNADPGQRDAGMVARAAAAGSDNGAGGLGDLAVQSDGTGLGDVASEPVQSGDADRPAVETVLEDSPLTPAIDVNAHAAATSPSNNRPEPTEAQKEAGNYKKGRLNIGGLNISVENPQDSFRNGTDRDGKPWQIQMRDHYGYIKGVKARAPDKEHVDVYVRPGTADNFTGMVYVVNQVHPDTGKFDEPKVMIGFGSQQEAETAYRSNYSADWKGMGSVTAVPMQRFKEMLNDEKAFLKPVEAIDTSESKANQEPSAAPEQAAKPVEAPAVADESRTAAAVQAAESLGKQAATALSALNGNATPTQGRPELRPLIEDLIRNKRYAEQSNIDPERALDRAKQILRGQRTPNKGDITWFRDRSITHQKAGDKANAETLRKIAEMLAQPATAEEAKKADEDEARKQFERSDRARKMIADRNKLDTDNDDLMTAIAKLGGIKRDEAISEFGFDPADLNRFRSGIKLSFTNGKNALTVDGMRESLRQYGYPVGETVRDFGDILDAAVRGGDVQTDAGIERDIQARIDAYEEQFADQPDAVHEAVDAFDDWLESSGTVMTDDDVEALFNGQDENEQAGQGSGRQDQQPAAETADGRDRDDQAAPANQAPREESQDLLGDNTAGRQAVADAARAKDEKRNSGESSPEDFTLTGSDRAADQAIARGAQDLFDQPATKPEEAKQSSTPLSPFDNAMDEYRNGTANVDDYKAAFKYVLEHEKEITEYLDTLTKKQLFERGDYSLEARYKNEKKERVVRALYSDMVGEFLLPGETGMRSYSHSYGGDKYANIKQQVDAITQESLNKAMARRQAVIAENAAKKAEVLKGIADPQTLDDFNNLMRSQMAEGMTLAEARKTLTPVQRERYDDMAATKTRSDRGARKNEQKTEVRAAVHTTTGDIIETKHTKTGEDLFVVKAAERVERDVYNEWNTTAKRLGGWYSSYRGGGAVPGFQFKTRENAEAFLKYLGGDVDQAKEAIQTRRDEFADDRSQTAVQRLTEMADKLEERADDSLGQERKANTARRARFAASAEAAANADKALAKTMRNIAQGIDAGSVKYLDQVRQKVQVEMLQGIVRTANDELLRNRYKSYREQEEHKHERPTKDAADFVQFPSFTAYRSDLASLGRALLDTEGTKKLGQRVMSVADDVTDAYLKFARENLNEVSRFGIRETGERAVYPNKQEAETAIARSNFKGKAIVLPFKRGQNMIILSPSEAMNLGIWNGDNDKRITLAADLGAEIVEKLGKVNRNRNVISVPWQFENAYDKRKRLAAMGIETPAELRAAMREFIGLQEAPQAPDKIKQMERAMIGRRNDGLDFFPTPASVADEMIETAGLTEGMRVLEPSAGMGHIADQIREAGVEPDVVEFSGDRRELLQAKGYNVVGHDFMDVTDGDYDRIIMNPPFGDRRDAAHVQHAYDLLKPGGRVVAIMGEGVFFGQDKRAQDFREWLERVGGTDEKLEEGTFNDPSLPVNTGVNARMVVIDKPEDAPKFRRGMDSDLVQLAVDNIKSKWKNAPDVVVVQNMSDSRIRKAVRDENDRQLSQGATGQPEGFFDNGKVYIIASEMRSARDVQRVLFHEALGHYGLRGVFGNDLNNVLDQVYLNRRQDVLAKAKSYGLDISKASDRRIAAEEVLAELAQSHPELNFVKRAIAAIRSWLRAHGFDIEMTDDEIVRELIEPARQFVQRGQQEDVRGMVPAFGREAATKQTETKAFKDWFGDSKVVDADGKPLVVYHGTRHQFDVFEPSKPRNAFGNPPGIYFTDDKSEAKQFAEDVDGATDERSRVVSAYVSIRAPYIVEPGEMLAPTEANRIATSGEYDGIIRRRRDGTTEYIVFRPEQIKSAIGNNGEFDSENPSIVFSRADRTPSKAAGDTVVTAAAEYLARNPDLFKWASTDAKTMDQIGKEIDPGYTVKDMSKGAASLVRADKGWEISIPDSVRSAMIYEKGNEVWIDVQYLRPGKDSGSVVYTMAASYAHNNGKVLIGDPAGLSRTAYYRRNEAMLSSALKYGTTRHLAPHVAQEVPAEYYGGQGEAEFGNSVRPLNWIAGDDVNNIREMIYTSWKSGIDNVPELKNVIFNPDQQRFERIDGTPFDDQEFERLVSQYGAQASNPYRAGVATQKRTALFNTFLRKEGGEGRKRVLDQLVHQLQSGPSLAPQLQGIFYSRSNTSAFETPENSKLDNFIYHLQDKHIDLKRVTEEIKKSSGEIADELNAYQKEELYHGRAAKRVKDFLDNELTPLIDDMRLRRVTMADLEEYLWARHAEERNNQIAKINEDMPDGGSGMTTQEARDYMAKLTPEQRAKYEALASRVDAMTAGSRQVLVEYGLESPDTIAAWQGAYQNYVPLMREDMDAGFGQGTGQGFSVRGNASKRATGSGRAVVDILANIAQQRERNITRGEKNRVASALVGLAMTNPNKEFWKVDAAPTIKTVQNERVVEQVDPLYKSRDNVVVARIPDANGNVVEHSVVFNEHNERALRMAASIKNLDVDNLGDVLGTSAKVTRYFAAVNTQYNPVFGIINLLRDAQGAMLNLTSTPLAGKQAAVAGNVLSALKGIYSDIRRHRKGQAPNSQWSKLFEDFQSQGGQTGYRDMFRNARERAEAIEKSLDPDWWANGKVGKIITANGLLYSPEKVLADKAVKPVFDWLSDYNEAMENAVRLSAYKAALDSGMTKPQAASLAKNLTVNFNRKGESARQIGALYAFFNASVQGTARIAETLAGKTGKRIITGGLLLGVMQAIMMAGYDDDEPPQWERDRNLIIPTGDGKYIKIAMPLGFNAIPAFGRIMTEWALDGFTDPSERVTHILGMLLDVTNPIGNAGMSLQTIAPTIIDPLAALAENKDWSGRPIAQEDFNSLDPTPGFTRSKNTASSLSKVISESLNTLTGGTDYKPGTFSPTPDQIDYLIGQVFGGVGRESLKAWQTATSASTGEELPTYKVPLIGRLIGNTREQAAQGAQFYNNLRDINMHENEVKGRRENGQDVAGYLRDNPEARLIQLANYSERAVRKLRKQRDALVESGASKERVNLIDQRITTLMKGLNDRVRAVKEAA
jgi:predicted RNA methylase